MKELLQYSKELKEFRRSGGLPQGDVKNELAKIYEANWRERWGAKEVNRSCPGCVRDMMKILTYEFESMQKEYKFPKEQVIARFTKPNEISDYTDPSCMKWGELRKYATEQGVNTKGKTKQEILEDLNG